MISDYIFEYPIQITILGICALTYFYRRDASLQKSKSVTKEDVPSKPKGRYYAPEGMYTIDTSTISNELIDQITSIDFTKVVPYKPDFDISTEEPIPFYRESYISDRVYSITMGNVPRSRSERN